jgi:hypothetical protein
MQSRDNYTVTAIFPSLMTRSEKSAFFADGLPISDTGGGKLLDRNFGCWSI